MSGIDFIAVAVYLAVLAALVGMTYWLMRRDAAAAEAEKNGLADPSRGVKLDVLPTPIDETSSPGFTNRIDHRFRRLIYQTGLGVSAEAAMLLMVLVGLIIGGAVFVWQDNPILGTVAFSLGLVIPLAYFLYARIRRMRLIREQLPDVMDLMARSVRAGESLDQSIESVGKSFGEPLGVEFLRTSKQLDMGLSMPAAMRALTNRAPLPEMRILAATFNVQRKAGGNVATNLDRLAHVIRDRLSYQRQFMAATGSSRMATILIALAGPIVFGFMIVTQPDYMGQFFTAAGGSTLLGIAIILQVVGLAWTYALLRNDY